MSTNAAASSYSSFRSVVSARCQQVLSSSHLCGPQSCGRGVGRHAQLGALCDWISDVHIESGRGRERKVDVLIAVVRVCVGTGILAAARVCRQVVVRLAEIQVKKPSLWWVHTKSKFRVYVCVCLVGVVCTLQSSAPYCLCR